jgi:NAD(P)H dehydrogenase (quinone)
LKHAVTLAHPNERSFAAAVASAYTCAAQSLGHVVIQRDLYRMNFDPCLKPSEIPSEKPFGPESDVITERALLKDVDVFALVYPLWLNAPPAIMKGYLERVFGFGFAYGADGRSFNPLLAGRKLITFSSSGAPLAWVQRIGAFDAIHTLFDCYFADLCGMDSLDHVHFGNIRPGASEDFIHARLNEVHESVIKHFKNI